MKAARLCRKRANGTVWEKKMHMKAEKMYNALYLNRIP